MPARVVRVERQPRMPKPVLAAVSAVIMSQELGAARAHHRPETGLPVWRN